MGADTTESRMKFPRHIAIVRGRVKIFGVNFRKFLDG
jgi:hypothetical protein